MYGPSNIKGKGIKYFCINTTQAKQKGNFKGIKYFFLYIQSPSKTEMERHIVFL